MNHGVALENAAADDVVERFLGGFRDLLLGISTQPFPQNRSASVADALRAIGRWAALNGVTRLAEATALDRVGVPVFYAVRPEALSPSAIVSAGRGTTTNEASCGALFECAERFGAETCSDVPLVGSAGAVRRRYPASLLVGDDGSSADRRWCLGAEMTTGTLCFVDVDLALFPRVDRGGFASTTGLGAARTISDAARHAALEVIERQALGKLTCANGIAVDVLSAPPQIKDVARRFLDAGIEIQLILCKGALPVFFCISQDDHLQVNHLFCYGACAHPSAVEAATSALTEVAQSRIGLIAGLRDDADSKIRAVGHYTYPQLRGQVRPWFEMSRVTWDEIERVLVRRRPIPTRELTLDACLSQGDSVTHTLIAVPLRQWREVSTVRIVSSTLPDVQNLALV